MFGIGLPELILILGVALIVVGPEKLPEMAKSIAKGMLELKKTASSLKESFDEEMKEEDPWKQNLEDKYPSLPSTTFNEKGDLEIDGSLVAPVHEDEAGESVAEDASQPEQADSEASVAPQQQLEKDKGESAAS